MACVEGPCWLDVPVSLKGIQMDYLVLNAQAAELIKRIGIPLTVTRPTGSVVGKAYGVTTPSKSSLTEGNAPASVIIEAARTMYVTASNQSFNPMPGDFVSTKTDKWQIVSAESFKPANVVIAWKLEIQ
jgi:hypothetical protein